MGSAFAKSKQPGSGEDRGDMKKTSQITENDSVSTDGNTRGAAFTGKEQPSETSLIQDNGISKRTQRCETKSMTNETVTSSKSSPGKSREGNSAFGNVEDLVGDGVKPKPSRKKKSEIMSDPNMFEVIDSHVAKTPESVCSSIPTLVDYLIKPAHTPLEIYRAIYQWITANIVYDIDGYMGRSPQKSCNSEDVLRNRSSVCAGYSSLFEKLCRCAGVRVKVINGYAKGFSHKDTEDFDLSKMESNHAWNAIFVEEEWRLVDSTWDAGYGDEGSFHKRQQDLYFLMDPEYFINSHLPYIDKDPATSESWQLLDNPVDPETFFKSVVVQEDALKLRVFPRSHKETFVHVKGETCIEIQKYSSGDILDTSITFKNVDENKIYEEGVATERSRGDIIKFHVRPPQPGLYEFNIFIRESIENKEYSHLFKYILRCESVLENLVLFPKFRYTYGPRPEYKELGFGEGVKEHSFFTTNTGELEIVLPTLQKLLVRYALMDRDSNKIQDAVLQHSNANSLVLSVRIPRKGNYRLIIQAPNTDENMYAEAAYFLVRCTDVVHEFRSFPMVSDKATEYQIVLHEPKTKEIPASSSVVFRFSSPTLKIIKIKTNIFKKKNDSDEWEISFDTPEPGNEVIVSGSNDESEKPDGLFMYVTK